jgi:hypothetical protein
VLTVVLTVVLHGKILELAGWAEKGLALGQLRIPERTLSDQHSAAQARLVFPAIDPEVSAAPQVAGSDALRAIAIGEDDAMRELDKSGQVGNSRNRASGKNAAQKAQLIPVDVAQPGDDTLIKKRKPDGAIGITRQVGDGDINVPVRPKDVGSEVANDLVFAFARHDLEFAKLKPDRFGAVNAKDSARLPGWLAPTGPIPIDIPGALHLEMAVDRELADAMEQMFTDADNRINPLAGQIDGRERRNSDVAAGEDPASECLIHRARRTVNGIALWH